MKAIKLLTNGETELISLPKRSYTYQSMRDALGVDMVEIVNTNFPELEKYCLVCDEEALLKSKPVINPMGSYLYGVKDHGQPLCGDVLIMKNQYTPEGLDTVGLEEEDVEFLESFFDGCFLDFLHTFQKLVRSLNAKPVE